MTLLEGLSLIWYTGEGVVASGFVLPASSNAADLKEGHVKLEINFVAVSASVTEVRS